MQIITLVLVVLVGVLGTLVFSVGESWGADYQKGLAAYEQGDFATALREWEPLAEQGDADAQHKLGLM
jgi:hypothetical protein